MLHQIGAGALGPVFRSYQPEPGRLVAVKLFRLDLAPQDAHILVGEFERLIAADLSHPGIAAPIGTGLYEVSPYLAQDFVTADSLDVVVRTGGSSSPADVGRVASQLGAALDYAAERGILHGALHPRDVMLSADDVRITGLGIARALEAVKTVTPVRRPYSAPERAVGGPWDGRADMFSFAALIFELLFGRRVSGAGERAVVSLPDVPGVSRTALKKVFAKALSGDPGGRFASGAAFADALREAFARKDSAEASANRKAPRLPLSASASDMAEPAAAGNAPTDDADVPKDDEVRLAPRPESEAAPENLSLSESVDVELEERQLHDQVAQIVADAQAMEAQAPEHVKRSRRKPVSDRLRTQVHSQKSEAADAVRQEQSAIPADIAADIAAFETMSVAAAVPAEIDPADLRDVETAAHGIEEWLDANEGAMPPGGVVEIPSADVAVVGHEHEALELHSSPAETLFDEHPLDLRETAVVVGRDVAVVHADIATPVDDDLPIEPGRDVDASSDRSAAALASLALETTRTAVWPLVLSLVVGGAIVLGFGLLWYAAQDSSQSSAPVLADSAPTRIDEPAIVTQPPSAPLPEPTPPAPGPTANTAPPSVAAPVAPVVSEPGPVAPAPRGESAASAPAQRAPEVSETRSAPPRPPARPAPPSNRSNSSARATTPPRSTNAPAARRAPAAAPVSLIGSLRVESRPAGASVLLDGRRVGATPLSVPGLNVGDHSLVIEMQGFRRWTTSVKIVGGQQVRVGASLEP